PEQVLRTFLIAMIEADEAGIRSVAMPRPNMEILWRQTAKVEPGVREQMLRDVRQARLRRLLVGEVIMLPGARRMQVTENDVNDGHLLIQMYDDPLPFILVRIEQR